MKPMGYGRILLDWTALVGTSIHLVLIPLQCAYGYPRYVQMIGGLAWPGRGAVRK